MSAAPAGDRAREVWAAGDYQRVGVRLVPAAEQLIADLGVRPGDRVLDVGGGTGNAALAAARRDADPLSEREREVRDLVVRALSNRDIAAELVLSERTVESHVRSILAKSGVANRAELIALRAPRHGGG